ncbi:hypothetical protein ACFOTA_24230 [Chitinophaga sp. GCM10012297]|uniref:DUF61 family protein n=1 Tax=Chitinophaga chungangae TaxID=2821488 RepID=A0ABS3YKW3_9BACT|nr:hypothetical protein [Chitinophaga chungangae]MBO9155341.1 hypothetical protein [Chitinophaga chungangae]
MLNKLFGKLFARRQVLPQPEVKRHLKKTGERIVFGLDDCEVKPFEITVELPFDMPSRAEMLDGLAGRGRANTVTGEGSYILYRRKLADGTEKRYFSPVIYRERTALAFLLYAQREISLYVDRRDANAYYFDLEFLD